MGAFVKEQVTLVHLHICWLSRLHPYFLNFNPLFFGVTWQTGPAQACACVPAWG